MWESMKTKKGKLMNRIFITGDMHRERELGKIDSQNFAIQSQLTKEDYLIITGDFGACWYGGKNIEETNKGYKIPPHHHYYNKVGEDDHLLDWYESRKFTTLFVDGNHENHKLLNTFPVVQWNGGLVHRIRPTVLHLMRGQVYEIAGRTFFTMGGAQSSDKIYRVKDSSWWPEELPSNEEYETALGNLERHNWNVDYVLTHCCGDTILKKLCTHHPDHDKLTNFFATLEGRLQYKMWFFGHHHMDRMVDEKHRLLYDDVVELE